MGSRHGLLLASGTRHYCYIASARLCVVRCLSRAEWCALCVCVYVQKARRRRAIGRMDIYVYIRLYPVEAMAVSRVDG